MQLFCSPRINLLKNSTTRLYLPKVDYRKSPISGGGSTNQGTRIVKQERRDPVQRAGCVKLGVEITSTANNAPQKVFLKNFVAELE